MVSTISIVFMGISAVIAIGLPVALFLFWRRKQGLKLIPLLVGAVVFVLAVMLNGGGEQALSFLGAMAPQTVDALVSSPAPLFLVSGAERIFAVVVQIALSVIVWYAATTPGKAWLFPGAIILHALVDAVPAIYQAVAAINVYAVEGILVVWALILSVIAWQVHKKYKVVESVEAGGPVEKNGPLATDEPAR